MKRRQFLISGIGAAAAVGSLRGALAGPCPPTTVQVSGGSGTASNCGQSTGVLPYALPSSGQALAIGTNFPSDIRPPSHSQAQWAYTLFNSYGSGVYVTDYSFGGAYVLAGTGGHNHPPNVDAVLFDFADATWKRIPNANGVASRSAEYDDAELTGAPFWEIIGTQVPAPSHPYRQAVAVSAANGGGSKGSVVYMGRAALGRGAHGSGAIHRFDLATGLWSRPTNAVASFGGQVESDAVVDEGTGRVFALRMDSHYQDKLPTLATSTWTLTQPPIAAPNYLGSGYPSAFLHPIHRLLIQHRSSTMQAINIDSPAVFTPLTVMGLAQSPAGQLNASQDRFCYYPPTGNFYWLPRSGGNTLIRLMPPASNPLTNAWVVDSTTISISGGGILPPYGDEQGQAHYRSLFYASSLECLVWVPGESMSGNKKRVFLIKPSK